MTENFQVRDVFNLPNVSQLANTIKAVFPSFDSIAFCEMVVTPGWHELGFNERAQLITDALARYLPADFPAAVDILLKALPQKAIHDRQEGYDGFIVMPLTLFVSRYGLSHFDLSMKALYEMTQRFTAEWAIRFFIEKYPEKTIAVLADWANDPNPHVRRLVSEGTRPLLPWAQRLKIFVHDPLPTLLLLEKLKNDPVRFVLRSVANHLNDHSKTHPDLVVETLRRWRSDNAGKEMDWLTKHATRTLVKNGHPGALQILGFAKGAEVNVENLEATPIVVLGDYLQFSFDLASTTQKVQQLVIDYLLYFKKASGAHSSKVFKLTTKKLMPGEKLSLQKRHSFKPITTRAYYPGEHWVGIQVNGVELVKTCFIVQVMEG